MPPQKRIQTNKQTPDATGVVFGSPDPTLQFSDPTPLGGSDRPPVRCEDPALGTAVFAATWMLSFLLLRLATAPSTGRWSSSVLPEGGEAG